MRASAAACFFALLGLSGLQGQATPVTGTVALSVRSDAGPVPGAEVRVDTLLTSADGQGRIRLTLSTGHHIVRVAMIGFRPASVSIEVRQDAEVSVTVELHSDAVQLDAVTVTSTRTERRLQDTPLRVEVIAQEEVEEKVQMSPGNIAALLNETNGVRVQTTSPSLGGANVRIQGLRGRYTQILTDGLPLNAETEGLGILQIPPVDLLRVEVIKGVASALYGAQALGGVVNLVSRPPTRSRELLLNQTSRTGTDAVGWIAGSLGREWGYTLLGSGHRQSRHDLDGDGWSDLAGFHRGTLRPRLFWHDSAGSSLLVTLGAMAENREAGTVDGAVAPDGAPFAEALDTRRFDVGAVGRLSLGAGRFLSMRSSGMYQRHRHVFGPAVERDRFRNGFGEFALTVQQGEVATWVVGGALQADHYDPQDVPGFRYTYYVPAVFGQYDRSLNEAVSFSASARMDHHSVFGTFVSPRLSLLFKPAPAWTARVSAGTGISAPSPLTEETEVIGLSRLRPLGRLVAERARGVSADVSGVAGPFELNGTLYASGVDHGLQLREAAASMGDVELVNSIGPIRTYGGELLVRWGREPFQLTATYTYLRSTETDPESGVRREVPLNPRHMLGFTAVLEEEGAGRIGIEGYYTGKQALEDDPYRSESRPYLLLGLLAQKQIGSVQLFLNGENLLNVKLTNYDPLVRPSPGLGGRWTTDAWAPPEGRVVNAGVRLRWR